MFRRQSACVTANHVMRQTLKQPCWFSVSRASQSSIPVLENPFKLIAHNQQVIDLLLDLIVTAIRPGKRSREMAPFWANGREPPMLMNTRRQHVGRDRHMGFDPKLDQDGNCD